MQATTPSLSDCIDRIESEPKTIRVCNPPADADLEALESFFESHDVDFEVVATPSRPDAVVDLLDEGHRLASSPLAAVRRYARAWEESMSRGLRAERPAVVVRLRDNYFESVDKQRMIMASRIVEFRAWNADAGELHAGFQQLSKLDHQPDVYRNLAASDVEVHVYGEADREPLPELDLTVHRSDDPEVATHWWVAYDGNGDDESKIALLARERGRNRFYGFWTEQPRIVDDVLARMDRLD